MYIAIGSDHAGFAYKEAIGQYLESTGHQVKDYGAPSEDSADYPDFAHPLAEAVEAGEQELGILVCGSGNGVAMSANKHAGVRAALCWEVALGKLARQHNNANVLCLPSRFISLEMAREIVAAFIATEFEGGRHQRRVGKIACA